MQKPLSSGCVLTIYIKLNKHLYKTTAKQGLHHELREGKNLLKHF